MFALPWSLLINAYYARASRSPKRPCCDFGVPPGGAAGAVGTVLASGSDVATALTGLVSSTGTGSAAATGAVAGAGSDAAHTSSKDACFCSCSFFADCMTAECSAGSGGGTSSTTGSGVRCTDAGAASLSSSRGYAYRAAAAPPAQPPTAQPLLPRLPVSRSRSRPRCRGGPQSRSSYSSSTLPILPTLLIELLLLCTPRCSRLLPSSSSHASHHSLPSHPPERLHQPLPVSNTTNPVSPSSHYSS